MWFQRMLHLRPKLLLLLTPSAIFPLNASSSCDLPRLMEAHRWPDRMHQSVTIRTQRDDLIERGVSECFVAFAERIEVMTFQRNATPRCPVPCFRAKAANLAGVCVSFLNRLGESWIASE